jgi:hypothetical protein
MTAAPVSLSGTAYLRLVGLGGLLGIPAALVASLFLALVHDLEHWLWDSLPSALGCTSPPWYLVIGLPAAGPCYAPGIALAALGTLSFGAVLRPRGAGQQSARARSAALISSRR